MHHTTMMQQLSPSVIDDLRRVARQIVRDLGFMQKGLAGTELSPSALHTILELGYGTVHTASELAAVLHLEKSSVSRLILKLEQAGLVETAADLADKRARRLLLTEAGQDLLRQAEAFGRAQLQEALVGCTPHEIDQIQSGLTLFAGALHADADRAEPKRAVTVTSGHRPGLIGGVTQLHARYYARNYGFGAVFERKVAAEMAEFMSRIEHPGNAVFSVWEGEALLGAVSIDGEDLGGGAAHLRWFIVADAARGMGVGGRLLEYATAFVDQQGFARTRLWTFRGLDAARHLYEKHGFVLTQEAPGAQWGTEVVEQEFTRQRLTAL